MLLQKGGFHIFICSFSTKKIFIRPPDILVGGLRFYRDSIDLSIFTRYPPRSLNGTQRKPGTCSEVSASPLQIEGPQTTFFRRLHNLMATLTSYLRNETR